VAVHPNNVGLACFGCLTPIVLSIVQLSYSLARQRDVSIRGRSAAPY
jgi:hypothetical protein